MWYSQFSQNSKIITVLMAFQWLFNFSDLISGMKVERQSPSDRQEGSVSEEMMMGRAGEVRHALRGKRPLDMRGRQPE